MGKELVLVATIRVPRDVITQAASIHPKVLHYIKIDTCPICGEFTCKHRVSNGTGNDIWNVTYWFRFPQFSFIFTFQHVTLDVLQAGRSLFAVMIGERDNSDQEAEEGDEKKNNDHPRSEECTVKESPLQINAVTVGNISNGYKQENNHKF